MRNFADPRPSKNRIDHVVKQRYGVDTHVASNAPQFVFPRQIAMYLMSVFGYSHPEIGMFFRRQIHTEHPVPMNHTTVGHAVSKIRGLRQLPENSDLDMALTEMESAIRNDPQSAQLQLQAVTAIAPNPEIVISNAIDRAARSLERAARAIERLRIRPQLATPEHKSEVA